MALELSPGFQPAADNLKYANGLLFLNQRKWIDARILLNEVPQSNSNYSFAQLGILYAMGMIEKERGDFQSALSQFETIVKQHANFRDAATLISELKAQSEEASGNGFLKDNLLMIVGGLLIVLVVLIVINQKNKIGTKLKKSEPLSMMNKKIAKEITNEKIILGRYTDIQELGRGAMGRVYKSRDIKLERTVVLKTIRLDLDVSTERYLEIKKRFLREARAAGKLNHPNIVIIYDVEEEDDVFFISMEYIEGRNLSQILQVEKMIEPRRATNIISQCCQALEVAHENGIIHRDIKPSNIMVLNKDLIKIVDFGVAKLETSTITHIGTSVGTPSYMSPEQIEGKDTDGRSDLFSLGVVFYEMLTGVKPFKGDSITTVIAKILKDSPPPPTELKYHLPAKIDEIILKMLAKKSNERYSHAKEVIADLEKLFQK